MEEKENNASNTDAESKVGDETFAVEIRAIATSCSISHEMYVCLQEMLKKRLQMKSEALMLISQDLEQCKIQRDQFKFMAEQIQERFLRLKKQMCDTKELNRYLSETKNDIV